MHQENIHSAKTNLSKLIERALRGEEVIIARAGQPLVRLAPIAAGRKGPPIPGFMKGKIRVAEDWNSEETNKEVQRLFEQGDG
jgi:prevent-host-death family protein